MMQDHLKFILNSKFFFVPSKFCTSNFINFDIYKALITDKQYEVKSNVSNETFQSFINYWINNEIPYINNDNINQYEQLSNEFDQMKRIITLFKRRNAKYDVLSLKNDNDNLQRKLMKKNDNLNKLIKKYHETNETIFKDDNTLFNPNIKDYFSTYGFDIQSFTNLYFLKEQIEIINAKKVADENCLLYVLDEDNQEAGVAGISCPKEDIFVPRSIFHDSKEYIVTRILERAFFNSQSIKNFIFAEDSELQIIEKFAFTASSLENIKIPASVIKIDEYAFNSLSDIKKIEFASKSQLSSIEKEVFAYSSLREIKIPSHVKTIGPYAFAGSNVSIVEIEENSELRSIKKSAFICFVTNLALPSSVDDFEDGWCKSTIELTNITIIPSKEQNIALFNDNLIVSKSNIRNDIFDVLQFAFRNVESIIIPPSVIRIVPHAFDSCLKLKKIEFSQNSIFISIGTNAFQNCSVESIIFPSCPIEFDKGWCSGIEYLNNIIIPCSNKNLLILNDTFIIGKSDNNSDIYDTLLFARRNIKKAIIPSFIRIIGPYAFEYCQKLKCIEFVFDSELVSIEDFAFCQSSINEILIPQKVKKIGKKAFWYTKLKKVVFTDNSELRSIGKNAFYGTSISSFISPPHLFSIGKLCFYANNNFKIAECSESCRIWKRAFNKYNDSLFIMIPKKTTPNT